MKFVALIPARAGSKRIKNKNIKLLHNRPLISYTIREAFKSDYISDVIVSSNGLEILNWSLYYGAKIIKRPEEYAQDTSSTEDVIFHALKSINADYIVLLQPTSPLRRVEHIDKAIKLAIDENADSVVSVCPMPNYYLAGHFEGKKYVPEFKVRKFSNKMLKKYRENGAVYVIKVKTFLKYKNRLCGKIRALVMDEIDSIDIDTKEDFELVERILCSKE